MEWIIFLSRRALTILIGVGIPTSAFLLMMHGQWWAIGYGLCAIAVPFVLQYLFMPAGLIRAPALYFMDKRQSPIAVLLLVIGGLYECLIISLWFSGVFYLFMQYTDADNFWIDITFAYGISVAPWLFISERLRQHETAGDAQRLFIASVHLAYIAIAITLPLAHFSPLQLMESFAAITCTGSLIGSISAWNQLRKTSA